MLHLRGGEYREPVLHTGSRKNRRSNLAHPLKLLAGRISQQGEHQVFKGYHANLQLNEFGVGQLRHRWVRAGGMMWRIVALASSFIFPTPQCSLQPLCGVETSVCGIRHKRPFRTKRRACVHSGKDIRLVPAFCASRWVVLHSQPSKRRTLNRHESKTIHTLQVHQIDALSRSRLVTVSLQTSLLLAAQSLLDAQIGLLVVCNPDGVMVGVISKTDIIRHISHCLGGACRRLSGEVMTTNVVACRPTDLLHDVLTTMQARGLVHMPVLDADQRPVGVVNARDALRALVAQGNYEQSQLFDYVMGVGYH